MFSNTSSTSHNSTSFIDPSQETNQASSSLDLTTVLADLHLDYESTSSSSNNSKANDPSSFSFPSISQPSQPPYENGSSFYNNRGSSIYNSANGSLKATSHTTSSTTNRRNHQHSWSLSSFPTSTNGGTKPNFSNSLFPPSEPTNTTVANNNQLPELTLDYDLDNSSSSLNISGNMNGSNPSSTTTAGSGSFNSLSVLKHRYSHSSSRSISNPLFLSDYPPPPSPPTTTNNNTTSPINELELDIGIEIDNNSTSNPSSYNSSSVPLSNNNGSTLWNNTSNNSANNTKILLLNGNLKNRNDPQHHKRSWSIAAFPNTSSSSSASSSTTFSQQSNPHASTSNSTTSSSNINGFKNNAPSSRRASSISMTSHHLINQTHLSNRHNNNSNNGSGFITDIHLEEDKLSTVNGSANSSIILEDHNTSSILSDVIPDVMASELELELDLEREMKREFENSNSSVGTIIVGSSNNHQNNADNNETTKNNGKNEDGKNITVNGKNVSSMIIANNDNNNAYAQHRSLQGAAYLVSSNNSNSINNSTGFKQQFGYVNANGVASINGTSHNNVVNMNNSNNNNNNNNGTMMRQYNYPSGPQYQYNHRYNPQNSMMMANGYSNNIHGISNKGSATVGGVQYAGNGNINISINGMMGSASSLPQLSQQLPKHQQQFVHNLPLNGPMINGNSSNSRHFNLMKSSNRTPLGNYHHNNHHNNHHNKNNKRSDDNATNGSTGNNGGNKFIDSTIDDFEGQIYSLCKDQHGCRFLQKQLDIYKEKNTGINYAAMIIFNEVQNHIVELMTNQFGNYLIQKLFDQINSTQRLQLLQNCRIRKSKSDEITKGNIDNGGNDLIKIALDSHGTRALQRLIEVVSTQEETDLIIAACENHIVQLSRDLNGNHVVQKMLTQFNKKPSNVQFIFDSAASNCLQIATHRHGCCVLQRCLDYGSNQQCQQLSEVIAQNCLVLIVDPFGNYVVQYVLSKSEDSIIDSIVELVLQRLVQLSTHKFGSNVIEKILRIPKLAPSIIGEILKCGGSPLTTSSNTAVGQSGENGIAATNGKEAGNKKKNSGSVTSTTNASGVPANAATISPGTHASNSFLNKLLHDPYGNYVLQTALDVAKRPEEFNKLAEIIRPCLPSVRNTVHGRRISSKLSGNNNKGK